ncbi:C39 family peptidase [Rhizobium leguminosarum]|uniref:C39 family peptidase n=1 Tax=Rhizobium leguminosarum TaxID=384 RepID=UPI001C93CAA9|nr:C39 family peptidase [Rhizobium leguminosarum]MBY5585076.1 hypothetical protein [Rhizobium leguminosarum]
MLPSRSAFAGLQCSDFPGYRTCTSGVSIGGITAQQECSEWCWAACVEAIFAFHGRQVSQERIVEKVFGGAVCSPAAGPQIATAIDGEWTTDEDDEVFDAQADVLWDTQYGFGSQDAIAQAAQALAAGNPLILGAMGHATMMTAITYSMNAYGVQINQVLVRDPWPGNPNLRALTPQEAMSTQFLAKVEVR